MVVGRLAGADGVDAKDSALQDLAVRAAWAAGLGESFYLSERTDPGSDAERTFVQIFGEDLERDGAMSGLYLPLKDEEGIVGILLFEAGRADFATPRERALAAMPGTGWVWVVVDDADEHHRRAAAAGARVLIPPRSVVPGSRSYRALDLEGHRWTFSTHGPGG